MDLVLKLNDHLKETEKELETLIQLKKSDIATTFANVIPTVSTIVPSTLETTLAPNVPLVTVEVITGTSTGTTQARTSGLIIEELIKLMEEMKLQVSEL